MKSEGGEGGWWGRCLSPPIYKKGTLRVRIPWGFKEREMWCLSAGKCYSCIHCSHLFCFLLLFYLVAFLAIFVQEAAEFYEAVLKHAKAIAYRLFCQMERDANRATVWQPLVQGLPLLQHEQVCTDVAIEISPCKAAGIAHRPSCWHCNGSVRWSGVSYRHGLWWLHPMRRVSCISRPTSPRWW